MEDNTRKIAAMTAVLCYLQAEEDAASRDIIAARPAPLVQEGFWSYSGRQSQMMLRSMAQMKLFPHGRG